MFVGQGGWKQGKASETACAVAAAQGARIHWDGHFLFARDETFVRELRNSTKAAQRT